MRKLVSLILSATLALGMAVPALAAVEDTGFTDVSADAWYADAVEYVRDNGLMNGTGTTAFSPGDSMTRAMLAVVLYRVAGSPAVTGPSPFTDVADGAWCADAVLWASQNGIVSGYGNGLFGADDPVSREQIATILWRYAGSPAADASTDFADESTIAAYALGAVNWARANGIINGIPQETRSFADGGIHLVNGNVFSPKSSASRAQVATMLMNYIRDKQAPPTSDSEPTPAPAGDQKVLVAYFSLMGNAARNNDVDATTSASVVAENGEQVGTTERIARMIQEQTGGDLHLIETEEPYPADFQDVVDQNHKEIADGMRPALASAVDLADYDMIFVGYPVWASTTPTPVLSFLESGNLAGKTVIPFCTHDGYGAGSSYSAVAVSSAGAAVEQGLAIASSDVSSAQSTVEAWLERLNLPQNGAHGNSSQTHGQTNITITIGGVELDGVLYDTAMAQAFLSRLPETVSMGAYGDREYYGGAGEEITPVGNGQLRFDNGDITYCPSNNTLAIFYAQTDRPDLTMAVYPIGRVTSDLAVFDTLDSRIEITFARAS